MKNLICFLFTLIIFGGGLFGQTPQSFNYQAVVRNDDGTPLGNQVIDIRISILEGSDQGDPVFIETHDNISTDTFGLISLEVGSIADLSSVNWSTNTHFIQIEIDVNGNANYKNLGAFQILAVPYAIYGRDEDSDPSNESISSMSLNGSTLEITEESGNTKMVDLSGLSSGSSLWTENSPGNISYDGQVVGVNATSGDKLVELGDGGSGDGHVNVFNQNNIVAELGANSEGSGALYLYPEGSQIGDATLVDLSSYGGQNKDDGYIEVYDSGGLVAQLGSSAERTGYFELYANDNQNNNEPVIYMTNLSGDNDAGLITVLNNNNEVVQIYKNSQNAGLIETYGLNNYPLVEISSQNNGQNGFIQTRGPNGNKLVSLDSTDPTDNGFIATYDTDENEVVSISTTTGHQDGNINVYASNGSYQASILNASGQDNRGAVVIFDEFNNGRAGLDFLSNGQSRVWADIIAVPNYKAFVMNHPLKPKKQIWYACIEGPEAAAYERGTAQLINGEAFIPFSETFGLVANPTTMTVNLTPLSAESMGMAVIEKRSDGFRVKELMKGKGNYEFDWEVKAVRKGFENFEVIRDKQEVDYGKSTSVNANRDNLNSTPKRSSTSKKPKQKN